MTHIMTEASHLHEENLAVSDAQLRLSYAQVDEHLACSMACAERVFETVMRGTREDHISDTELLEVPKTLEMRSVDDHSQHRLQGDVITPNRIMDDLTVLRAR